MEGKRVEILRKGPWKAEEDEVLINHVKNYGPRDWSSIRSKGLLQRTGKSCRLRWVNKLRPNLKNGCKFTAEEERVVIELQAQFGNKWAKIATYLPGRTDNDVKNFWSSRQKRLTRILQNSGTPSSSSKSLKLKKEIPGFHDVPLMEASKLSSSMEELSYSKGQSCSTSYLEKSQTSTKVEQFPELVNPQLYTDANMAQLELMSRGKHPYAETRSQVFFPQIPQPQPSLTLSLESQDLLAKFEDPYFSQVFADVPELDSGNVEHPFSGFSAKEETDIPMTPDAFFHDFPADMFDQMEPLPSPSE
ncbi:Transcription factor MYB21 [Hibiscus syriacus]|uniref:Transcription factor MYB21 n=1 Tax=Hibiscus syriacus TaxID=106335 RepID=A0A6A2YLE6_HIBSY|nr:transcription factor DUO1-like [Hibiscus syriacus]KAE8679494.1 Transcription factor MYB21 [Hibiscus syriacus]